LTNWRLRPDEMQEREDKIYYVAILGQKIK